MFFDTVVLMFLNLWRYLQGGWLKLDVLGADVDEDSNAPPQPALDRIDKPEPARIPAGR